MYSLSSLVEFLWDDARGESAGLVLVQSVGRVQVLAVEDIRPRRQGVERVAFILSTDAVFDLNGFGLGGVGIITARLLYQGEPKLRHKDIIVARKEAQSLFEVITVNFTGVKKSDGQNCLWVNGLLNSCLMRLAWAWLSGGAVLTLLTREAYQNLGMEQVGGARDDGGQERLHFDGEDVKSELAACRMKRRGDAS